MYLNTFNKNLTRMKKRIFQLCIISLFIGACTGQKENQQADSQAVKDSMVMIQNLEKQAVEITKTNAEIIQKANELDAILKDLDQ